MALQDTDLLAVYRALGDSPGNYKTTVGEFYAQAPASVPTLTAVLQKNNVSDNLNIQIDDSNSDPSIVLAASSADDSIFSNNVRFDSGLKIGSATLAKFRSNGELLAPSGSFIGQPSSGVGLEIFPAGTTISQVSGGTASNAVVTIKNDGTAYFSGALAAESIDGGTWD